MEIIIPSVNYSDDELNAALFEELRTGVKLMEAKEALREQRAAQVAQEYKGQKGKHFMHLAEIPVEEFNRIGQKYGFECFSDREFVRYFQKKESHMASNKA